jgi:5-methylcytosine-specific restriction protein A
MPSAGDFRTKLKVQIDHAAKQGRAHIDINAGELHRDVGGYPGPENRMPMCCDAMYREKRAGDEIISQPPKGKGASLTIRYKLPRR